MNTNDIVEQIKHGDSVVIYQTLSGWVRISPSKAPQRWVLEEYLCLGQSCWVTHSTTPLPHLANLLDIAVVLVLVAQIVLGLEVEGIA